MHAPNPHSLTHSLTHLQQPPNPIPISVTVRSDIGSWSKVFAPASTHWRTRSSRHPTRTTLTHSDTYTRSDNHTSKHAHTHTHTHTTRTTLTPTLADGMLHFTNTKMLFLLLPLNAFTRSLKCPKTRTRNGNYFCLY